LAPFSRGNTFFKKVAQLGKGLCLGKRSEKMAKEGKRESLFCPFAKAKSPFSRK
jgi:hypothetical protein